MSIMGLYQFLSTIDIVNDLFSETSNFLQFKAAKKAYESVMVILPRRPTTEEFFDFEKQAIELSAQLYGYKWPEDAEVFINAEYQASVYVIFYHPYFVL